MERALEKTLERIDKLKGKNQFSKARKVLEELSAEQRADVAVAHEAVGLSLQLDSWQDLLKHLRRGLMTHSLANLLAGSNREPFVTLVRENIEFSNALLDLMGNMKHLEAIAEWFQVIDPDDQRFLIKVWLHGSDEEAIDAGRIAMLKVCAGVGLFISDDEQSAFRVWNEALAVNPRQLKKIMAFCQTAKRLDSNLLVQRLKLIKLVATAGKQTEALTLLKALGYESDDNALKVLNEMPELLPNHFKSKEVLAVRFSLALKLADNEILQFIIQDMDSLTEDELFPFKRQALHQIPDKQQRTAVLLDFVRLYMHQENWENAAPLLQMLYEEAAADEVVDLMEKLLDRFPIISPLRFTLGNHHLHHNNIAKGIQHLTAIAQVAGYRARIRELLEDQLLEGYNTEIASLLVRMHGTLFSKAGIVGLFMALNDPPGFLSALSEWGDPHMQAQSNPYWGLAMVYAYLALKRYEQALPFLCQILENFPEMAPELVRICERFCSEQARDYTHMIRLLETISTQLQPSRAWIALSKHFVAATRTFLAAQKSSKPDPRKTSLKEMNVPPTLVELPPNSAETRVPAVRAATSISANTMPQTSGLPPEFHHFKGYLEAGNFHAAAKLAEKTVAAFPQTILYVLNQLERLSREQPREILWPLTLLRILIVSAAFPKAVEVGRRIIAKQHFQAEMPQIYQLLARAYEGTGDQTESLRFYCLSSRQTRFYEQNRNRLPELVLPHQPQFIDEVVNLVHNNEDQEVWEELLKAWHKARPEDLAKIVKAQEAFTEQLGSPHAILDMAFWYLQAGRSQELNDTLNRIDLKDPEILDYLSHIAHLAHLKYPADPKPKFLLGKYHLMQQDPAKAVDTFRNLAHQIPESAETIYHFLRTYLKKNATEADLLTIYGLLIRFALDHGPPVAAVRLLEELGHLNEAGATALVGGVYRVLLRKEERLEAMYELMRLLKQWGHLELLVDVAEQGGFNDHMAVERLEWLHVAAEQPALRDRSMLAIAQIYCDTFEFTRCREALQHIEHSKYRRQALPLYEQLAERFPEQLEVWREAGWAAFPQEPEKARYFFSKIFESPHSEHRLEAYALLVELNAKPDFEQLSSNQDDLDALYQGLAEAYLMVRKVELAYWESTGQPLSKNALNGLIETAQYDRFREDLMRHEDMAESEAALLKARSITAQGRPLEAAWQLSSQAVPVEILQSYFHAAGMTPLAILLKKPGTLLPTYLQEAFTRNYGRPAMIRASYTMIKACAAVNLAKPASETR